MSDQSLFEKFSKTGTLLPLHYYTFIKIAIFDSKLCLLTIKSWDNSQGEPGTMPRLNLGPGTMPRLKLGNTPAIAGKTMLGQFPAITGKKLCYSRNLGWAIGHIQYYPAIAGNVHSLQHGILPDIQMLLSQCTVGEINS